LAGSDPAGFLLEREVAPLSFCSDVEGSDVDFDSVFELLSAVEGRSRLELSGSEAGWTLSSPPAPSPLDLDAPDVVARRSFLAQPDP
jgi:hypothetical protein